MLILLDVASRCKTSQVKNECRKKEKREQAPALPNAVIYKGKYIAN